MSDMSENTEQRNIQQAENENTCVVCFKKTFIFSIGSCNHPVCYECSARMRCLCLQNECPICRQDLPRVIFTKTIDLFSTLDKTTRSGLFEKKFRIVFGDLEIQKAFYFLLEHRCRLCEENNLFVDFYKLKEHVRKVHEQFYCEICTENLKVFSSERRSYTRPELAQHRRVGDPDNKSHRGHPRCDYCELRYLDKDELFRHLRREHYFCHLCDADGINLFYGTVREMRDHFKAEHFLCEEDDCLEEEFTAVYRTEIDLRAHKATVHSKSMSRMEVKQARTLDLDISYGPRGRGGGHENSRNHPRIRTNDTQREFDINPEPQIVQNPPIQIDTNNEAHFPSLGPSSSNAQGNALQLANSVRHVYYGQQGLARTKENFPALGFTSNEKNKVQPKQNNGNKQSSSSKQSGPTASSLFKASANKQASSAPQQNYQQKPQSSSSNHPKNIYKKDSIADFPSLGPSSNSSKNTFFTETSKFSSSQSIDRKPTTSVAPKSSATTISSKKNSFNDFPAFGSTASKKRDLLMEDLILSSNNNIDKGMIAAKHKGLVNDYVSIASQMTKVSLVKQKEESIVDNKQFVPTLSSENNFPTLGSSDSASKPPQWITVNTKTNNQKQQPQQNVGNKNSYNPKKQQQQYEVPQKNQKTNGTKKVNDENKKSTNEKKIVKDTTDKENRTMLESKLTPKPPPGFQQIQPITNRYHPMPDASKRNQALVEEIQKFLTNDSMQQFRLYSQNFRDGTYFARSYYESCRGVLGEKFESIFPELLVLLPDIDRQQKLYRIHLEETLTDVDITDDTTSKKKNKKMSQKNLEVCATCQQVLLSKDLSLHVQSHSLENNFPTLSNETKSKAAGGKK